MDKFKLKNGQEAELNIWNFQELRTILSQDLPTEEKDDHGWRVLQGFHYLRKSLPYEMELFDPDNDYSKEKDLSPLEIQIQRDLPKIDYHKTIVASFKNKVMGVLFCQWIKGSEPTHSYLPAVIRGCDHGEERPIYSNLITLYKRPACQLAPLHGNLNPCSLHSVWDIPHSRLFPPY